MNIPYLKVNSGAKTTMSTNLSTTDLAATATPCNSPVRQENTHEEPPKTPEGFNTVPYNAPPARKQVQIGRRVVGALVRKELKF